MIKETEITQYGYSTIDCIPHIYANQIQEIVLTNICANFGVDYMHDNKVLENELTRLISNYSDISFGNKMNKRGRTISRQSAIKLATIFQEILRTKKNEVISFVEDKQLKYASFSYRILRPNKPNDIGKIHYDNIFIEKGLQTPTTIKRARRYKVWIPIINDPRKNNLLISPYSHVDIEKHQKNKDGNGDLLNSYVNKYEFKMVPNKSFQPLIFSMNLLHGGTINTSENLRISLEFEIIIQDGILQYD